jgi:hypothetical protein
MNKKRTPVNYVDNAKFYEEISKYHYAYKEAKANDMPLPRISNYLGLCISEIAHGLARKPNFSGYSYKSEMISDAIENCLAYLHSFNPEKSTNPFAYYTQTCYYAFIRRIDAEKKQSYVKYKSMEDHMLFNNINEMSADDQGFYQSVMSEMEMDKLASLEEKYGQKKKPAKKKKPVGVEKFIEND